MSAGQFVTGTVTDGVRRTAVLIGLALVVSACGADATPSPKPPCPTEAPTATGAQAVLQGAELATVTVSGAVDGEVAIDLYGDEAPIATANFVALAGCGFYDGIWFHRILAGFVIQAGDPSTKGRDGDFDGLGRGGPGYRFAIEPPADDLAYVPYSVSMANAAPRVPDSNGSQFFIALSDLTGGLPRDYTIFGQVVSGTETVDAIGAVPVNDPSVGVPLDLVTIESIVISSGE
ncbi:MAG: peptidylprolyl isomerase [Candidatus Limnocylindria bacterium]